MRTRVLPARAYSKRRLARRIAESAPPAVAPAEAQAAISFFGPGMWRSLATVVLMTAIWAVSRWTDPMYSLPIWLVLLLVSGFRPVTLLGILLAADLLIGAGTLTFGPVSVIQLVAVAGLLVHGWRLQLSRVLQVPLFWVLVLIAGYFTWSYYQYHHEFTPTPLNWLFCGLLVLCCWRESEEEVLEFALTGLFAAAVCVGVNLVDLILGLSQEEAPFGNPRQVSFFGLFGLVFGSAVGSVAKQATIMRAFASGAALLFCTYPVMSGSRFNAALVVLLISLVATGCSRVWPLSRTQSVALLGLLATLALTSLTSRSVKEFLFRDLDFVSLKGLVVERDTRDLAAVTSGRSRFYEDAIAVFLQRPLCGVGFLSWNSADNPYNPYDSRDLQGQKVSVHSTWVQHMVETGIVGTVLYMALLLLVLRRGYALQASGDPYVRRVVGEMLVLIALLMAVGGLFDNHSMKYRVLQLAVGIAMYYSMPPQLVPRRALPARHRRQ